MSIIYGFLERITYHNEENDFVVAKLQEKGKRELTDTINCKMIKGKLSHKTDSNRYPADCKKTILCNPKGRVPQALLIPDFLFSMRMWIGNVD